MEVLSMKGILGRKLGMTQVFCEDGTLLPVTVIEAVPNVIVQKKTIEQDGYEAVQLGFEDIKEQRANKPQLGHTKKANTGPKRFLKEITNCDFQGNEIGSNVSVEMFQAGDTVDVIGTSKGRGYNGTIVRNNAKIGPKSHGSGHHRHIGSLATNGITSRQGKILKGTMMAGHEGGYTTTNQNLVIVKVDVENNYLLVKGNVPGPKRGMVMVKDANCSKGNKPAVTLVNYTVKEEE